MGEVSWGCQQLPLEFLVLESVTKYALPWGRVHLCWVSKHHPRDEFSVGHKEDL